MSVVKKQSNHNSQSFQGIITRSQWELKVKTTKLPEAREKRGDQVAIGVSFQSGWSRKWREFSEPVI